MVKRFVGREPFYRGKTLFELCCNLKNFGEGRVLYRHQYAHFPETSYYRLTKVQPDPDYTNTMVRKGTAWGEKVYRGLTFGVTRIDAGHKADWFLVPKNEEEKFCKITSVLPKKPPPPTHIDCPPLLKELISSEVDGNQRLSPFRQTSLPFTTWTNCNGHLADFVEVLGSDQSPQTDIAIYFVKELISL